jgi:hypothetical protein
MLSRVLAALLLLVLLTGITAAPIRAYAQYPPSVTSSGEEQPSDKEREIQRTMVKAANKKRQEDLKRDTEKLLQLATELKLYVDKTNENVLSLDVIKKAEEIEKLSKDIQKKMRSN